MAREQTWDDDDDYDVVDGDIFSVVYGPYVFISGGRMHMEAMLLNYYVQSIDDAFMDVRLIEAQLFRGFARARQTMAHSWLQFNSLGFIVVQYDFFRCLGCTSL